MITKDYLNFHRTVRHIYLLVSSERGYSFRLNTGEEGKVIEHTGLTGERRWFHWADQQSLFSAKVT